MIDGLPQRSLPLLRRRRGEKISLKTSALIITLAAASNSLSSAPSGGEGRGEEVRGNLDNAMIENESEHPLPQPLSRSRVAGEGRKSV